MIRVYYMSMCDSAGIHQRRCYCVDPFVSLAGLKLGLAGNDAIPAPFGNDPVETCAGGALACRILANFASIAAIFASVLYRSTKRSIQSSVLFSF